MGIYLGKQPILTHIKYHATGVIRSARWGNGLPYRVTYDQAGRIRTQTRAGKTITYDYDPVGNITRQGIERYGYDLLDRLIGRKAPGKPTLAYTYDNNGNRRLLKENGNTTRYQYKKGTNQLTRIANSSIRNDAAGNRVADSSFHYFYNARNRLARVKNRKTGAITRYAYNAYQLRISKKRRGKTTYYIYNTNHKLVAEADQTGEITKEYLWIGHAPIAVTDNDKLYYIHTDHLGTPRIATNNRKHIVWNWQATPFGMNQPKENGLTLNLRFPGQYYDKETELYYNHHRYYEAETGRYLTSDPIGLGGGFNRNAYAENHVSIYIDPYGLWASQKGFHIHQIANLTMLRSNSKSIKNNRKLLEIAGILRNATKYADSAKFQTAEFSYRHAMRGPGQTVEGARKIANWYIKRKFKLAWALKTCGREKESLFQFGLALHTLQD